MSHRTWWAIRVHLEHNGTQADSLDVQKLSQIDEVK